MASHEDTYDGAELRPDYETLRQSLMAPSQWDAVQALRQRIAELERENAKARQVASEMVQDVAVERDRALAAARELRADLRQIAKREGRFSRDPLTHAGNTIDDMAAIAEAGLARTAWLAAPEENK